MDENLPLGELQICEYQNCILPHLLIYRWGLNSPFELATSSKLDQPSSDITDDILQGLEAAWQV